jgi:hypothetical protein
LTDSGTLALEISPIPPDTTSSVRASFHELVSQAMAEAGQESLLEDGKLSVAVEQPFPGSEILVAIITGIAVETFKEVVLPKLKRRLDIRERRSESQAE